MSKAKPVVTIEVGTVVYLVEQDWNDHGKLCHAQVVRETAQMVYTDRPLSYRTRFYKNSHSWGAIARTPGDAWKRYFNRLQSRLTDNRREYDRLVKACDEVPPEFRVLDQLSPELDHEGD